MKRPFFILVVMALVGIVFAPATSARWYTNKDLKHVKRPSHTTVKSNTTNTLSEHNPKTQKEKTKRIYLYKVKNAPKALDQLFLTGKLVNLSKKSATIDVFSESCRGRKRFFINKELFKILKTHLENYKKWIHFGVDSNTCSSKNRISITELYVEE